jgi:LuxR family transcriptional regulator, maltose regulon positive regulatory protein
MTAQPIEEVSLRERGRDALARGAWEDAVATLESATAMDADDGLAWELLGTAHSWLQGTDRAIEVRQKAYAIYRERGDDAAAARVSLELANDFYEVRGEMAVANGWFQRARRLLDGLPPSREHALLKIWDSYMSLLGDGSPEAGERYALESKSISEAAGADDTLCLALALQGLAQVSGGRVVEGMTLLDEAIAGAIGGEFADPQWFYLTCCCMIDACDRARDYGRSLEWCHRLREHCARWRVQAFLTTCRIKYTGALLWRGEWDQCEAELERAAAELSGRRPASLPGALVRLAELRRRQGRLDAAEVLLQSAATHPDTALVRASIALDSGDAAAALELVATVLRHCPREAMTERVAGLEIQVRAQTVVGLWEAACEAAEELKSIATAIGTGPIRAVALTAEALILRRTEPEEARRRLEDAIFLLETAGSAYQAARVRVDLVQLLAETGRSAAAVTQARTALAVLEPLGATRDAECVAGLLASLEAGSRRRATRGPLTRRQGEVLGLVAAGLGDREIAARLHLSEHTVHRHVANIMTSLDVTSRTAAVARALRAGLI